MLVGYVSDENYVALSNVDFVFEAAGEMISARSLANGAVVAPIRPGSWRVTLSCAGFGAKRVTAEFSAAQPYQFRLLSDGLLGYAWPKWVRSGEASEFRVHAPEAYRLELWRYGWKRELVRRLGWFDDHGPRSTVQVTPDGDFTQTGIHWNRQGYGSQWHQQKVVAPERSGLYYFHAKTASGDFFSFPWIVQPRTPSARIVVLTSNITWNAYNNFGGRSNYINAAGLPPEPTVNARQDLERFTRPGQWPFELRGAPLSFDRPELFNSVPEQAAITDTIPGRLASAMAPAEWRLLGWLEREGFSHDLYSETELHFDRVPLESYQVVVLNTHPEYYSPEMYFRLKQWVFQKGGKLLYLGGCGFLCELEFSDESTIICRQEERSDLRGESEACLLGLAYSHGGYQSGAPYRVLDDTHWAFANTGLRNGSLFGHHSLHERCPGGASGHELDKLSPHSPPDIQQLAKGNNPENSGADLVYFETPGGGAVFSVGSLCWTLSIAVDDDVSRVTANVLRRFLA